MAPPATVIRADGRPGGSPDDRPTVESVPKAGRFAAIHPLLFAAYPVLFLWSQNLGETNSRDVLLPLIVLVGIAAAATFLLGLVFGDRRRAALIVTPLLIGLLMYGHAANLLGTVHVPGIVQQAGWAALVVIGIVAAIRLSARRLATVDTALDRIAAILVVVTLVLIVPFQVSAAGRGPTADRRAEARHDDRAEARRLLADLRPLRIGSRVRTAVRDQERHVGLVARERASRSSTRATPTTSGPGSRSRRR